MITVTCPSNLSVCLDTAPFALTGGSPVGGTFSGTGVNGGIFSPSSAGMGPKTITYTYTVPGTNCTNSCTFTITVNAQSGGNAGTISGTSPLCIGTKTTYTTNGRSGGTWSSTVTGVASVDPGTGKVTALSAGTTNITYTVNSNCGGSVSSFKTLTVTTCQNNIPCGKHNEKVIVCHKGHEICIKRSAVQKHLAHGDVLGHCPARPITSGSSNPITSGSSNPITSASSNVLEHSDKLIVKVFPNPYAEKFNLNIQSPITGMATIQFYNTLGNKLYELKQFVTSGISNVTEIKSSTLLKAGVVFYKLMIGSYESSGIVIKQE
jgi:hypothetical protein